LHRRASRNAVCAPTVPPFAPPRTSEQLRYIVLPQATKLAIAPTVGFLVQGVKGGALTSAIAALRARTHRRWAPAGTGRSASAVHELSERWT
jgi:hypothetical protein